MAAQDGSRPNRRRIQAAQTRRDIILAASKLFTQHGYAHTSVADIAREAGVAVQTIYASVGTKPQLITAMLDEVDTIAEIPELAARIQRSQDAHEVISLMVRLTRQLNERCRDIITGLRSGAHVDADLAVAYAAGAARHRDGAAICAQRLARLNALRPGLDTATAATTIAVLLSTDSYAQLHTEHGWPYERCEQWLRDTLNQLLLPTATPEPPKGS
ncbi:TetR/AcrR family transcriptional regulator [Planotetraspora kaengkrachanensis]|uniref:TetR/AcrR family transcriptional regulator n=1 Tax=Planotetraspora kaengkrachanensis TaxID=575193 RepID=UPI0019443849|nr:TetR/AcrR family transcriptional regulator [Planotetraspora kaengkrachanensis]